MACHRRGLLPAGLVPRPRPDRTHCAAVGLDGRGWQQLLAWLTERRAAGTTILLATHEMALAATADRVVRLEAGRIAAQGEPAAMLHGGAGR